jgi:hypothetical protein
VAAQRTAAAAALGTVFEIGCDLWVLSHFLLFIVGVIFATAQALKASRCGESLALKGFEWLEWRSLPQRRRN